eukprot:11051741-Karenia_brevis.AAC.1
MILIVIKGGLTAQDLTDYEAKCTDMEDVDSAQPDQMLTPGGDAPVLETPKKGKQPKLFHAAEEKVEL